MAPCSLCSWLPVAPDGWRIGLRGLGCVVLDIRQEAYERLAERFKMTAMPLVLRVDGGGNEPWRHEGFVDFPALSRAVADLSVPEQPACLKSKGD